MILSRTLAKRRIAAGVRPGWLAAWGPVLFDAACLIVIFVLLVRPFQTVTGTLNFPTWASVAALIALMFIPVQVVMVVSSLWATRSRYSDENTP